MVYIRRESEKNYRNNRFFFTADFIVMGCQASVFLEVRPHKSFKNKTEVRCYTNFLFSSYLDIFVELSHVAMAVENLGNRRFRGNGDWTSRG